MVITWGYVADLLSKLILEKAEVVLWLKGHTCT